VALLDRCRENVIRSRKPCRRQRSSSATRPTRAPRIVQP